MQFKALTQDIRRGEQKQNNRHYSFFSCCTYRKIEGFYSNRKTKMGAGKLTKNPYNKTIKNLTKLSTCIFLLQVLLQIRT